MFKKNYKIIFSAALISVVCFGCSGNSESNSATNNTRNQTNAVSNNNAAPTPMTANINTATSNNLPPTADNKTAKPSPAANMPTAKIGTGGDDMALFAQVRNALSADPDLFKGVIVEVKEGNATLSGKVSSAEKKVKAEQLAKNVSGIKTLKNNISIAP